MDCSVKMKMKDDDEKFLQPYIVSNPFESRELTYNAMDGWMDDGWIVTRGVKYFIPLLDDDTSLTMVAHHMRSSRH